MTATSGSNNRDESTPAIQKNTSSVFNFNSSPIKDQEETNQQQQQQQQQQLHEAQSPSQDSKEDSKESEKEIELNVGAGNDTLPLVDEEYEI